MLLAGPSAIARCSSPHVAPKPTRRQRCDARARFQGITSDGSYGAQAHLGSMSCSAAWAGMGVPQAVRFTTRQVPYSQTSGKVSIALVHSRQQILFPRTGETLPSLEIRLFQWHRDI